MTYEDTAIKECKEETGVEIDMNKLLFLTKMKKKSFDEVTGLMNNTIRSQYAYFYEDSVINLQIENGKAEGFEVWKIDDLFNLSEKDKNRFISLILNKDILDLFEKARKIFIN